MAPFGLKRTADVPAAGAIDSELVTRIHPPSAVGKVA